MRPTFGPLKPLALMVKSIRLSSAVRSRDREPSNTLSSSMTSNLHVNDVHAGLGLEMALARVPWAVSGLHVQYFSHWHASPFTARGGRPDEDLPANWYDRSCG